jgi:hypothetical protein
MPADGRTGRLGAALAAAAMGVSLLGPLAATASGVASTRTLLSSRNLWATVDVCSPGDQPNTVGIRGSMPGDGEASDRMYMSFRLQMLVRSTQRWKDLGPAGEWVRVGNAGSVRQAGTSFVVRPRPGSQPLQLRGLVLFQWRRGARVLASAQRTTGAGHQSLAGADPPRFSAASCLIG